MSKKTKGNGCKEGEVHAKEMDDDTRKPKTTKMRKFVNQPKPAASSKLKHTVEIKATVLTPHEVRSVKKKSSGAERQHTISSLLEAGESFKPTRKRKQNSKSKALFSKKNLRHGSEGTPEKPKLDGEVQNGKTAFIPGNHKRKNARTHEFHGDGNNKNDPKKNQFKKQKGNIREGYKSKNPKSNTRGRMGHVDSRNFTRYTDPYAPKYAVSALNSYHEPPSGYSGYGPTVLLEPAYRSQYSSRYLGRDVLPAVQPYSLYHPSEYVQIAHDPYRVAQRDDGGPFLPASQGRNPASYYQAWGSYMGAYQNQQTYN